MTEPRTSSGKTMTVCLLSADGATVRRVKTPRGTTFILNLKDRRYYDAVGPRNPRVFIARADKKADLLSVECPCCGARAGWACGRDHTDPIHRARIVRALQTNGARTA